jgi:ankyrin repeat protein
LIESSDTSLLANATVDLFSATRFGSIAAIEQVIQETGTSASLGENNNKVAYSALVTSIFDDQEALADVLIEKAAIPIDDQGVTGNTPLMWSAIWCKANIMTALLNKGADVSIINADKDTALSLAKKNGCAIGANILRSFGASG